MYGRRVVIEPQLRREYFIINSTSRATIIITGPKVTNPRYSNPHGDILTMSLLEYGGITCEKYHESMKRIANAAVIMPTSSFCWNGVRI
jgi:hypothetical protein